MKNSKNKALIVASNTSLDLTRFARQGFFIVGVERGALILIKQKVPIDLAIGDFDKVSSKELKVIQNYSTETLIASKQKDFLDGELAILELKKRGFTSIKFIAEPTVRYDKTISMCDLVWRYNVYFFNSSTIIFRIGRGKTTLEYHQYQDSRYLSFFALRPSIITINNLKYNVKNLPLLPWETRAISNEFIPQVNGEIETDQDLIAILSF